KAEAEQMKSRLPAGSGEIVLCQGNSASLEWCESAEKLLAAKFGKLDFLICNSSPPIQPLWLEPCAAARIQEFLSTSFAQVSTPMTVFLRLLARSKGWNVVISSIYVQESPPHFPHYVPATAAV